MPSRSTNCYRRRSISCGRPPTAKQITLAAEFSPMYLGVLADRDMLMQVAINLLSNAIKYTPDGGRVTLRSRVADEEVQFEVDDTGVGLERGGSAQGVREVLSCQERSRHGERNRPRAAAGQAHRRRRAWRPADGAKAIWAREACSPSRCRRRRSWSERVRSLRTTPYASKKPCLHSILLCDDDIAILRAAEFKLSRAGFDVRCANNGRRAWEEIERRRPTCSSPISRCRGSDGFGLCRRVREHPPIARSARS